MKKIFGFLFIMGLMPIFVACSSDDDSSDVNLTSDEILTLLKGKWEVSGEFRANDTEAGKTFDSRYKGTIEFKDNEKYIFSVTEGEKYNSSSTYLVEGIVNNRNYYTTLKKDGKNYISFRSRYSYSDFEIVSLNKNSFKLVLNTNNVYMTMYSI